MPLLGLSMANIDKKAIIGQSNIGNKMKIFKAISHLGISSKNDLILIYMIYIFFS